MHDLLLLLHCSHLVFRTLSLDDKFQPETNEIHDMFKIGGHQKEPLMIRVAPDVVLLLQETKCVFADHHGKPAKSFTISWSGVPQFIGENIP